MLDSNFIREHPEAVKENIRRRGVDPQKADVVRLLKLDEKRRELLGKVEKLNHERTAAATKREEERGRQLKKEIKEVEKVLAAVKVEWQEIMDWLPNMLSPDTPEGRDETENVEIKAWAPDVGYLAPEKLGKAGFSGQFMPTFAFPLEDHVKLGKALDLIDVEQSGVVSGSRFYYLKNEAALIQYGVFQLLSKKLVSEGFIPMVVPLLVRERVLYGTSHFPGDADQVYKIENKYVEEGRDLYLVGSSEPPLFAYYMDKTLNYKDLPQKFFAITSCFRSEVGSWGKDVRGIKRVHQFDKLEMDAITTPEGSREMQEYLLSLNEWLLQQLKLPYHVILMCSGNAGYAATYKKYDFEVWLPVQKAFVEMGSDTNAWDFQARRFNTKYVNENGQKKLVHNVNDTGITGPRTIIAILENYQQADGTVKVPEVLRPYVGKDLIGNS